MTLCLLFNIIKVLVGKNDEQVDGMRLEVFFRHDRDMGAWTKLVLFERAVVNEEFNEVGTDNYRW